MSLQEAQRQVKLLILQLLDILKSSLELGGKNPTIIFDDCDYDKMLKTTIRSSFGNQGQICLCGERIFIQSSLYDRFKEDFVKETKKLLTIPYPKQLIKVL